MNISVPGKTRGMKEEATYTKERKFM